LSIFLGVASLVFSCPDFTAPAWDGDSLHGDLQTAGREHGSLTAGPHRLTVLVMKKRLRFVAPAVAVAVAAGLLWLRPDPPVPAAPPTIHSGSTRDEVVAILGKEPDEWEIIPHPVPLCDGRFATYRALWYRDKVDTLVTFDDEQKAIRMGERAHNDPARVLRILFAAPRLRAMAPPAPIPVNQGMNKDEVVANLGKPTHEWKKTGACFVASWVKPGAKRVIVWLDDTERVMDEGFYMEK
jgi:hypothetical protein